MKARGSKPLKAKAGKLVTLERQSDKTMPNICPNSLYTWSSTLTVRARGSKPLKAKAGRMVTLERQLDNVASGARKV